LSLLDVIRTQLAPIAVITCTKQANLYKPGDTSCCSDYGLEYAIRTTAEYANSINTMSDLEMPTPRNIYDSTTVINGLNY
jgi:hypothetical protein